MNLPVDRSREFRAIDYPQQPQLYTPLRHFIQRMKEPERHLTPEIIRETINHGDLRDNEDGCACFRKVWGNGVAYYLIAGFHEEGHRVLVTGWPHLHHRGPALESGRWTRDELDEIHELNESYQQRFEDDYPAYSEWMNNQPETNE
jgi:hypothetical protein